MEKFFIAPTKSSPEISFDPQSTRFVIRGESYPENCGRFYLPMFAWLRQYFAELEAVVADGAEAVFRLDFEIIYFNSSSSKTFMDLFDLLDEAAGRGVLVTVNWRYHEENETALECGEEFQEDVHHMAFRLVEVAA